MADQTILIMRHAEKPEPGGDEGVDATGVPDPKSLTPRGWQRAHAWAELFAASLGQESVLPKPTAIFASAPASPMDVGAGKGGSKSRRPVETISPLATSLGIEIDLRFAKGQEADLAATISTSVGVVCWQHENIVAIANAITPTPQGIPISWPADRFNIVFRFDRSDETSPWDFQQVVPVLLQGDSSAPI